MLIQEEQDRVYHAYEETIKIPFEAKSLMHITFKEYCAMYVFTTENIHGYLSKMKVKEKDVLTVTASGDHLINLALAGVKSIHNFDINKNAYYMTQLKLAALKTLEYEEFLQFFTNSEDLEIGYRGMIAVERLKNINQSCFDYKIYLQIRENLKEDCALYWDMLYEKYQFNGLSFMENGITVGADRTSAIYNNTYLQSEENYRKARDMISSVEMKFFPLNVLDLHNLPYTYDYILLSNIYEYVTDEYIGGVSEDYFNQYITEELSKKLNNHGVIAMAYKYNYKMKNNFYKPSLKNLFKRREKKWELDRRESLEKFTSKKILVPSVNREYRTEDAMDCLYLQNARKR